MEKYQTHRCKQILEHNINNSHETISIRKVTNSDDSDNYLGYDKWSLYVLHTDYDWDSTTLRRICRINICPICGEILE